MDDNFRYKTSNYSLHYVLRQIESGRMDVDPSFKDLKQIRLRDRSLFIESLILGIPTLPIWCEESPSGDYIVLEGSERLIMLKEFVEGDFPLTHLKIRKEYQDFYFKFLPYHEKIALEDRYPFTFIIINYDTPPQLKCEFIRRLLNDTGNGNNQSARNFAWPRALSLLYRIKEDFDYLMEFGLRDTRWRPSLLDTSKRRTEIDEVLLFLLMIHAILDGKVPENAYIDQSFTVSDLLDWSMSYYDQSKKKHAEAYQFIGAVLSDITSFRGHPTKILLTKSMHAVMGDREELTLPEFYVMFVRACSGKNIHPTNWQKTGVRHFSDSSPAQKLISFIFEAKND